MVMIDMMKSEEILLSDCHELIASCDKCSLSFPAPIAAECRQMSQLLRDNAVYGIMFQMRDLIEIIAKFLALSSHAVITACGESSGFSRVLLKPPATGDWFSECMILEKMDQIPAPLKQLLKDVMLYENKAKFTSWRNNYLGHGARIEKWNTEFCQSLQKQLDELNVFLNVVMRHSSEITLCLDNVVQTGYESVYHVRQQTGSLSVCIVGTHYSLYPYIFYENGIYYFFNKYSYLNHTTNYLNISHAKKINRWISFFESLYENVALKGIIDESMKITDSCIPASVSSVLDSLNAPPVYLVDEWLVTQVKTFIDTHKKGIICLTGDANSGKSAFVSAIDGLIYPSYQFAKSFPETRCYYSNRLMLRNIADFPSQIRTALNQKMQNGKRIRLFDISDRDIPQFDLSNRCGGQQFISLLNYFYEGYNTILGSKKLMFAIDGFDVVSEYMSDLIDSNHLRDGVYLLLTSRKQPIFLQPDLLVNIDYQHVLQMRRYRISEVTKRKIEGIYTSVLEDTEYDLTTMLENCVRYGVFVSDEKCGSQNIILSYMKFLKIRLGQREFDKAFSLLKAFNSKIPKSFSMALESINETMTIDYVLLFYFIKPMLIQSDDTQLFLLASYVEDIFKYVI